MSATGDDIAPITLRDLVATTAEVASTRSRTAKIRALCDLLRRCTDAEIAVVVGLLVGQPRQGKIGVGWASLDLAPPSRGGDADADRGDDVPSDGAVHESPSLEVLAVDRLFDDLGASVGAGSVAARHDLLADVRSRSTSSEWDLLVRILLGEMRTGALGGLVLDALAAAFEVPADRVRRAHLLTGSLGETAILARAGIEALDAVRLEVLRPIQPMLAATSRDVAEAVRELHSVSVEWKLDGARIQVHRESGRVRIVTRNLNDVTDRLPEVVELVRALSVSSVVLDGEVLRMRADGRPEAFQDTMSRFGTDSVDDATAPAEQGTAPTGMRPFFFDCMHLNGVDLLDAPLEDRLRALAEAVGELRVPSLVTNDPTAAQEFADDALARGHEGVMVKSLASVYEAGRRGSTWLKVKPVRTLDLVVLAAEWGHGRRQGWLSNLHLGARSDDGDGFVMVGKTFKGLTDAMLAAQTEALLSREVRRSGITVVVRPELVIEIALDGVLRSSKYPGGVALRFARVKGYRPDRDPSTADALSAVRALLV